LALGDEIQVTLDGNATTGFSWELVEYNPAVIAPVGEPTYEAAADGELVGTGGSWTWTLRAVAAGESPVRFVYHRTWEDEPPESTFSFTAAVDQ
jgi:inhibitor of cysteine peptidase